MIEGRGAKKLRGTVVGEKKGVGRRKEIRVKHVSEEEGAEEKEGDRVRVERK